MASKFKHPGLQSMGYYFNDELELRQIQNDEPFKWEGQQHYDVLVRVEKHALELASVGFGVEASKKIWPILHVVFQPCAVALISDTNVELVCYADLKGDQVTEWIQDYMVAHYGMKEIWLGDSYPEGSDGSLESDGGDELEEGKVVHAKPANPEVANPMKWDKPSRAGVFTIDEADEPRVTAEEMMKHAKVNIFISSDFYEADKLLVLVQGSGAVRPGQWARALCINHSLQAGTIFDYLDIARELGMATIVLNPNQSSLKLRVKSEEHPLGNFSPKHSYPILGHEDHVKHILHVWDHFVAKSPAKQIWMVAHSRGGDSALQLLNHRLVSATEAELAANGSNSPSTSESKIEPKVSTISQSNDAFKSDLSRRLKALAFTDSVHWIGSANSHAVLEWMEEKAADWVASKAPLDTPEPAHKDTAGCDCYSAGHTKHEWTSPCAVNSIFKFFVAQAEPGTLQRWNERRIAFSTPPQNMPAQEASSSGADAPPQHARTASYADVASGRASVHMKTSPVANASPSNETTSTSAKPEKEGTTPKPDSSSSASNIAFIVGFGLAAIAAGAAAAFFLRRKKN